MLLHIGYFRVCVFMLIYGITMLDLTGQTIVDTVLEVKYSNNGNTYIGEVRLKIVHGKKGRLEGVANRNRPNLIFTEDARDLRATFYDLKLPPTAGLIRDNFSLRVSREEMKKPNSHLKIKGLWGEKKLQIKGTKRINVNLEILKGKKINIIFPYRVELGNGILSDENLYSQLLNVVIEEDLYRDILATHSSRGSSQYVSKCENFITYFPYSDYKIQVGNMLKKLDEDHWNDLNKMQPHDVYKYLRTYRKPLYYDDAVKTLSVLHNITLKRATTIKTCDKYLKNFEGIRVEGISIKSGDVKQRIENLDRKAWKDAERIGTKGAYRNYLSLFEGTRITPLYRKNANNKIKRKVITSQSPIVETVDPIEEAWRDASTEHTIEAYEIFLQTCMDCEWKEEAMQRIFLLKPMEIIPDRDSVNPFLYHITIKNTSQPWIVSVDPAYGIDKFDWTHDSTESRIDIEIQDRNKHKFVLADSLGKRDTFEIDINIDPIKAELTRVGEFLNFTITGGIPPYYVQFEPSGSSRNHSLSGLYKLGDLSTTSSKDTWRFPLENLSPDIIAGEYTVIIKDSRQTDSDEKAHFQLERPTRRSPWVYLIGPLFILIGFLTYRNLELG